MIFAKPNRRRATFTIGGLMVVIAISAVMAWLVRPKPAPPPRLFTFFLGAFW